MEIAWLQSITNEAHLCVVDDDRNVAPVCGHVFLTGVHAADDQSKRCEACSKVDLSGDEINMTDREGVKFVVREARAPAHTGSLDPFDEIAVKLQELGVAFVLVVGMQGQVKTKFWSNISRFGRNGIDAFEQQMPEVFEAARRKFEEAERRRLEGT